MPFVATTELPADVYAPAAAREFVGSAIATMPDDYDSLFPDVVLVLSELVTNAVLAGAVSLLVEVRSDRDGLTVAVQDDAGGFPEIREPSPEGIGGRGLAIVAGLADSWSASPADSVGKRLSATWSLPLAPAGGATEP